MLEGNIPAYVQTYLVASDATPQQVDEWYRTKLTASGWRVDSKTDFDVRYVRDTREAFTIGFPDSRLQMSLGMARERSTTSTTKSLPNPGTFTL